MIAEAAVSDLPQYNILILQVCRYFSDIDLSRTAPVALVALVPCDGSADDIVLSVYVIDVKAVQIWKIEDVLDLPAVFCLPAPDELGSRR